MYVCMNHLVTRLRSVLFQDVQMASSHVTGLKIFGPSFHRSEIGSVTSSKGSLFRGLRSLLVCIFIVIMCVLPEYVQPSLHWPYVRSVTRSIHSSDISFGSRHSDCHFTVSRSVLSQGVRIVSSRGLNIFSAIFRC
jgi:hypothetical protein